MLSRQRGGKTFIDAGRGRDGVPALVGRHFRQKRAAKKREKNRVASQAGETRQVRRARERKERGE
jgi:hypothetical protein